MFNSITVNVHSIFFKLVTVAIFSPFVFGCASIEMKTPKGFAVFDKDKTAFRAVTADGVRIKVRKLPNEPKGEIGVWKELMLKSLGKNGYIIHEQGDIKHADAPGFFIVSLRRLHTKDEGNDFAYFTGLIVTENNLFLAEAAAPFFQFKGKKSDILDSLKTLKLK